MRSMTIKLLLEMIDRGDLVLPAMQRPFVWQEDRILLLMDSLMRLFPIGTVLVWETDEAQRYRPFQKETVSKEQPLYNFPQVESGKRLKYVLDGQQRLTSLYIACTGALDGRRLYLDILSGDPDDRDPGDKYYEFCFLTTGEVSALNQARSQGIEGPYFVPFEEFHKVSAPYGMVHAARLSEKLQFAPGDELHERLLENYCLAVNILAAEDLLQVHVVDENRQSHTPIAEILELFVRVNSAGLDLQKADLLMSLLDLAWNDVQPALLAVAREASKNSPVEITHDLVLKSILLYLGEESRFDRLVGDRDRIERIAPSLRESLPVLEEAWKKLAVLLRQDCRINSPRFFGQATNALLPFVVWLAGQSRISQADKNTLVTALYIGLMSRVFGSAEYRMGNFTRNDCRDCSSFPIRKLATLARQHKQVMDLSSMLENHLDLALNIAQKGTVLDDNPDQLERDHIFPRARLEREGVSDVHINSYANFHFLRQEDNRNKTDRPPHEWFRKPGENAPPYSDQDLRDRLLSWELIQPGMFNRLLETRASWIRSAACELFHMSESEFNDLFE